MGVVFSGCPLGDLACGNLSRSSDLANTLGGDLSAEEVRFAISSCTPQGRDLPDARGLRATVITETFANHL